MIKHYKLYPHILKAAILERNRFGEVKKQTKEQLENFFDRNPGKEWMRKEVEDESQ